ncbi:IS1/IS1595 family N-terminal zinc-binding domain-containing protein [Moorena producens]
MECPLCDHHKTHKQVKTRIGHQRYYCPVCRETTCTFDTLYYRATD